METFAEIKRVMFAVGSTEPRSAKAPAIMIIDDNAEIIEALTSLLHPRYRVVCCLSYEEVNRKLSPDVRVVLLDLKMAGKDGIEVFKLLKSERDDFKIIFHSAYPGDSEKIAAVEHLNHSGYLTKGQYQMHELLKLIDEAMNQPAGERAATSTAEVAPGKTRRQF